MARAAKRYDIFLPIAFNDGRPVPGKLFQKAENRLLARFGGLTTYRREFPLQGIWQGQTRLYFDQVIIMTVLDFHRRGSGAFLVRLKSELLQDFEQEEILITEISLRVH